jgi:hypothetical protein
VCRQGRWQPSVISPNSDAPSVVTHVSILRGAAEHDYDDVGCHPPYCSRAIRAKRSAWTGNRQSCYSMNIGVSMTHQPWEGKGRVAALTTRWKGISLT